ncbi:DeoR family transcriptional regulator [Patescibacteria group bacterium]|nr:DeoR family transcriptional regulator [Patescibacteria group bacterium]MBU2633466.1 DeoR family transcriptional regulator [Patescibacteria group bacterium]
MNGDQNNQNKEEEYLAYLCSRIQRATEAVYRVTDLLSDKEPMKWEMREESTFIFTHLAVMKNKHSLERGAHLERIADSTDRMSMLFTLFEESGSAVLSANFRILKKEYESIKKLISQEAQKQDISHLFLEEKDEKRIESPIGQNKDGVSDSLSDNIVKNNVVKRESKELDKTNSFKGQERKDKILEVIKDKEKVSVGELSSMFKQYSEKTIQRDLVEFVSHGVLRKEGDKRWRRYMLI